MMLQNWKVSTKLFSGFGIVLALLLVIIAVYFFALTGTVDRYNTLLHREIALREMAVNVNRSLQECRRQEKNFLMRLDKQYLDKFEKNFNLLKQRSQELTGLAEKAGQAELSRSAADIIQLGGKYGDSFRILAASLVKKGLDHQTGLQGEFRNHAQLLEADVTEHAIADLKIAYLQLRRHEKDYLLLQDKTYVEKMKQAIADLTATFQNSGTSEKHIQDAAETVNKYQKAFDLLVKEDDTIKIHSQNMIDSARAVEPLVEKIETTTVNLQETEEANVIQAASQRNRVALLLGGLALLTGLLLSTIITISIKKPLAKTLEFAKSVRSGDLSARLGLQSRDEIGELARTLDEMVDNLNTKQNQIQKNLSDLENLIREVATISEQVHSGAQQVSDSSQALSQGATEQAASLEQITSSMTQIGTQTSSNAENATQANQISIMAKEKSQNGKNQMNEMVQAMTNINASSQEIGKIIKTIDSIAFQTNLLALNAAVEAARAGSHGKGFAVVAQEVRSLAARSAQAAQETTLLIETAGKNVERGNSLVEITSKALDEIDDSITKVTDIVAEISVASNEQAQGISQINQGLGQIDSVTQQNTATAEETSAASEELSSQAAILRQLLSRFGNNSEQTNVPKHQESTQFSQRIGTRPKQLPLGAAQSAWGQGSDKIQVNQEPSKIIKLDDLEMG